MKTKTLFSFMVAAIIALFAVSFVVASTSNTPELVISNVEANDVVLSSLITELSVSPGETIPVVVRFTASANLTDLRVKLEAGDAGASTSKFDVVEGSTYIKRLSLTIPNVEDMDGRADRFTLHVKISNNDVAEEEDYYVQLEREAHAFQFLQADAPNKASAGEIIAIDVVLQNIGARDADNAFVIASIPELGVSKRAYFGDLVAEDNTDSNDNEDARERRIYLIIPSDAVSGTYNLEVKASNYDATNTVKKTVAITGLAVSSTNATNGNAISITNNENKIPTSVLVLTVVLVIVFIVLLIVLIVLLTKKPEKSEDLGETSYY